MQERWIRWELDKISKIQKLGVFIWSSSIRHNCESWSPPSQVSVVQGCTLKKTKNIFLFDRRDVIRFWKMTIDAIKSVILRQKTKPLWMKIRRNEIAPLISVIFAQFHDFRDTH